MHKILVTPKKCTCFHTLRKLTKQSGQLTYQFQKMVNLIYDDNVLHFLIEGTGIATLSDQLLSQTEISMS
jgi:hypothetical protein